MTEVGKLASENFRSSVAEPVQGPITGTILTKFADPLRIPPVLRPQGDRHVSHLTIRMRASNLKLHSELPPTPLWTYDGHFPGPTIDVRRSQRVRVTWSNEIDTPLPMVAVEVDFPPGALPPGNTPGRDGAQPRQEIADLPPWTVVHLHGAATNGGNDGLAENAMLPGDSQLAEYPNEQQATMLWYHDHAMNITSLTVPAGLAGMYLIRDDEDDQLGLPCGPYEIPLMICDRNLDMDSAGRLTGQLLYKVAAIAQPTRTVRPFFGPYTLVNGVIWPHLDVAARWYRFRLVNAANARTYRLVLIDEQDQPLPGAIIQIGSDAGLLPEPVPIDDGLTLAPAERADVLIDFSAFCGRHLRLVNTVIGVDPPTPPGRPNPAAGLAEPDVLQFRVGSEPVDDPFVLPEKVSRSFRRLTHDSLPHDHVHRWIVTTPPVTGHPGLWEMVEVDPTTVTIPSDGVIQVEERLPDNTTRLVTLQRVASSYGDAATFFVRHGDWEQWKFLSLGGATHPMHIHLIGFQVLGRDMYDISTFDPATGGTTAPVRYARPGFLHPNEQGWKDTIRVGSAELISVAGQFRGGTGRFMYHCHILEHEDEGMMRSFLVMPDKVMSLRPNMHGGGGHEEH